MKKLLTLLFLFVAFFCKAQITITTADLPTAGTGYILANDSTYFNTISGGGVNQVWNYSQLLNTGQDTLSFQAAAGTPYASNFPAATLAANNAVDSAWAYFISNPTGFYISGAYDYRQAGVGGVSNVPLLFNPPLLFIPTPFTYGSFRTSNSRLRLDLPASGGLPALRIIQNTQANLTGDGYGSLTTPYQTYANTIRVKTVNLVYDSILADVLGLGFYTLVQSGVSQNTSYKWYKNGHPSYLLGVECDSLGINTTSAEFLNPTTTSGIAEIKEGQINSYPNPASNFLSLNIPQEIKSDFVMSMYNAAGQLVSETQIQDVDRYMLSLQNMPNGIYTIRLVGNKTFTSRVVVQH